MSRKRNPVWKTLLTMAGDAAAIGAGLYGAYWLRFHSALIPLHLGFDPYIYHRILPYAWLIWFVSLRFENLYRRRSRVLDFNVVRRLVTGSCLALLALIAFIFFRFHTLADYSRAVALLQLVSVVASLIAGRVVLHYFFRWLMLHHGIGQSRAIVLGGGPLAAHLCRALERNPEFGVTLQGVVMSPDASHEARAQLPAGVRVLGTTQELEAILARHKTDEVILAQPELERDHLPALLVLCERAMADFRIVPETTELLLAGMTAETLDGIPLLGVRETPLQGWNAALKRMVDFCAAVAGLVLMAPIIALLAWLVRRHDGGPAFYMQERMGIDGRLFKIIKLRSMRLDAETQGPTFASDIDSRCTPLGHILRRSHLDELPQLLNVLRGQMSLVGPRPERPYFIEQFRDAVPRYMVRHKVKSGITGWAQVNGLCGPHGSIDERLKYDLYYIENWSLTLDLKILLMTVFGGVKAGPV